MTPPAAATAPAEAIAAALADSWQHEYGPTRPEIPLAVLAALCLNIADRAGPAKPRPDDILALAPTVSAHWFVGILSNEWHYHRSHRPALAEAAAPLSDALDQCGDAALANGAQHLATTCLDHGLDDVLAQDRTRRGCDLLGALLHRLRHDHAPDPIAALLRTADQQSAATLQPGSCLSLGAGVGTGARLIPIAAHLRHRGIDPASIHWQLREPDALAAACLAANTALWGLGPDVLISTDTAFDWAEEAHDQRRREGSP